MRVRDLTSDDVPFLCEMLYAAAFWHPSIPHRTFEWAMEFPYLMQYYEGWGRPGDVGCVAEIDGDRVGAAWYRLFTEEHHGDGYIDPETPELAIAVVDGHRGAGVGRALMLAIAERGRTEGLRHISLSVDPRNARAKGLYASLGYEDYEPGDGKGRMLLKLG